jgi:hypothetical protein
MIRLIAVAFALALASSAEAMPPAPIQQSDEMVIQVREGCGAGMRRTAGGACVRIRGFATQPRRAVPPGFPSICPDCKGWGYCGPNPRGCRNQHTTRSPRSITS